jgi:iron-sulfur cluster repair protein YtfE (RIC family)
MRATATMSRDHVEVGRLKEELRLLRSKVSSGVTRESLLKSLRRVLYGLYALVKVHFAKEEEIYLPLLDAGLTPDDAQRMFEAMERAARTAQSRHRRSAEGSHAGHHEHGAR